jgi:hypothetical protein
MTQDMNHTFGKALRAVFVAIMMSLPGSHALAQVIVNGSVFGGGNDADVMVNTEVNISAGTVEGNVYGGGNLGDVGNITKNTTDYNYTWTDQENNVNTPQNNTIINTNKNTGVCSVNITDGTIGNGTFDENHGNVFGGGKGVANSFWCEKGMAYATSVCISKGTVNGNVYGGGQIGRIEDDTKVTIGDLNGTDEFEIKGNVFGAGAGQSTHGYSALVRGNSLVTIQGKAIVKKSVYGGGEIASVGKFKVENSVPTKPLSGGTCTVTIQGDAKIGTGDEGGEVFGACKGVTPAYTSTIVHWMNDNQPHTFSGENAEAEYLAFLKTLALTSNTAVTISGNVIINGSVFGGGQRGVALGSVAVNMTGGTVNQDVYGGGALADTNTGNWHADYGEVAGLEANDDVTAFYERSGSGTTSDPYVYTLTTDTKADNGKTYYSKDTWAHVVKESALYTTTVRLLGGSIRNVYGGGLGQIDGVDEAIGNIEAYVYGDVRVNLNGLDPTEYDAATYGTLVTGNSTSSPDYYISNTGCKVEGDVFGCNNKNGSPKGSVTVNVYKTVARGSNTYHVNAVYGGGNLAAYLPVNSLIDIRKKEGNTVLTNTDGTPQIDEDKKALRDGVEAKVEIFGCDNSIETVYGGGNAASTPANHVIIHGGTIETVFGGGNGAGDNNPGANVGYKGNLDNTTKEQRQDLSKSYIYGSGVAKTDVYGGEIEYLYGGSNSKGNIREVAVAMLDGSADACTFDIGEAYGGGKAAPMDGVAKLDMRCVPKMGAVYGGAQQADVFNDVVLNITSGTIGSVYGGNNLSGRVLGSITVNVEETSTSCHPIIIGELYGGGNQAGYSIYGYYTNGSPIQNETDKTVTQAFANPRINLKSFTSIGNVYGGGKEALMVGSPQVNINEVVGGKADVIDGYPKDNNNQNITQIGGVDIPSHTKNAIGAINNVYGGGYGADLIGDVEVNIATEETVTLVTLPTTATDSEKNPAVVGADIKGSVFGGGYGASTNVTGDVVVTVGRQGASDDVKANTKIGGDVYGGSALGKVNKPSSGITTDKTTNVILYAGTIAGSVYGGGKGEAPVGNNTGTKAEVYGNTEVKMYGDMITGGLYGGCNLNGEMKQDVAVTVLGGKIGVEFDGSTEKPVPTTIPNVLFGGGKGAETSVIGKTTMNIGTKTTTETTTPGANPGDPDVTTTSTTYTGNANIYGNVYGGSENGSVGVVEVNLYANTIWGNVFGGGYETASDKTAATTVDVLLDGTELKSFYSGTGDDAVPQTGQIFGCNNKQGSPTGLVTVQVKRTIGSTKNTALTRTARTTYDVAAVYGGGNKADYKPLGATDSTLVVIEGCDLTSIKNVYGGGNAAAVPASGVTIKGSYIIDRVFGGGNGAGDNNPGAHVGYYMDGTTKTKYTTGKGTAVTKLYGGTINHVFGGSNTLGDIRKKAITETKKNEGSAPDCCTTLDVGEMYGAGSHANVQGDVSIILECMPEDYVAAVYGGAEEAIINGNVTLTVTSGKFGRVFGGNNKGGSINGTITVNVKEEGCKDLEIGELYGGGNLAPYSKYGCYYDENETDVTKKWKAYGDKSADNGNFEVSFDRNNDGINDEDPYHVKVYVESCTSIGKIFGGGLGETAIVTGDTYVNVNMMYGSVNNVKKTKLGHIGQVFGGGSAANVIGDTKIDIGTATASEDVGVFITKTIGETGSDDYNQTKYLHPENDSYIALDGAVYGGGMNANVDGNTTINIGTVVQSLGTLIDGNVYGGGKEGDVSGDTQVNICAIKSGDTYSSATLSSAGVTITGDVFGAGQGLSESPVGITPALTDAQIVQTAAVKGNSYVYMGNGWVKGSVYGGGELASVGDFTYDTDNITITGINNETTNSTTGEKEAPTGTATVNIFGGKVGPENMTMPTFDGHVFGAGKGITGSDDLYPKLNFVNATDVTISGTAFVMGSVYGGSENGHVRTNTLVKIQGGQIGAGFDKDTEKSLDRYGDDDFIDPARITVTTTNALKTCAAWPYDKATTGKPYDMYEGTTGYDSKGGADAANANDGHTFFGNVFGGGSGYYPYAPGKWLESAGSIGGNTVVTITGGHILSNVYGGNEQTNVEGSCTITMSGGTIGVPRTKEQIEDHPVIGNLFGAGKGDKRVLFNTWTNVASTSVTITGGKVYGSVFGGGEDGHVTGNATTKIEEASEKTITIGSTGESGADGNVFGGGRGSETALTAGVVGGNVILTINSGNILGSVYGGGRLASVGTNFVNPDNEDLYGKLQTPAADHGNITMNINGGTIGTNTENSTGVGGNIFGASKGTATDFRLGIVRSTTINMTGGTAYASVYGGGELAQVVGSHTTDGKTLGTEINISGGTIGTENKGREIWGNVFGGGKGNITDLDAGLINTNTKVNISQASGKITKIWHNIYGGGAYGSVGTFTRANDTYHAQHSTVPVGTVIGRETDNTGIAYITITGGTIGTDGHSNGMIFGSSRGDVGAPGEIHDRLAWVYDTHVTIGDANGGPQIKGSIYGSGENGHTFNDTEVIIHKGTIGIEGEDYAYRGNVYGGGCGTDKYYSDPSLITGTHTATDGEGDTYNALAGIVYGNATVTIDGGTVVRNVYGAGAMGSVGTITNFDILDKPEGAQYKHNSTKSDGAFYDFGLSWPYEFTYGNTGLAKVTIEGDAVIGGHVFGAARGAVDVGEDDIAEQRYVEAKLANVREAQVIIGTEGGSSTTTTPTIHGSVYGGGEDGHVNQDASVTIHRGRIDHSVFGGGKGESTFKTTLWDPANEGHDKATTENVHSWTAGKVYGSTTITMNGGSVGYNIYGGGNLASVGIGNYAGGSDDYSTVGYGELPPESAQALWTNPNFMGSDFTNPTGGLATVTINAGQVGVKTDGSHTGTDSDGNPYGSVFGSSRGKAALNVGQLSPRYRYVPDFFLGYVNQTAVTIGDGTNTPEIFGSVYGGGQDGHVRRSTNVTINKSTIGHTDVSHSETLKKEIGNVFGAGSGLGTYTDILDGNKVKYNNSSGSVTCTTTVEVNNGANILGNVYGGGALSSVGPPFTGQAIGIETKTATDTKKSVSFTQVDIKGGTISGNVYGASRGGLDLDYKGEDPNTYATDLWSTVNVSGGAITGSVFGGGEAGQVKGDVDVNIIDGTINKDVYGGGALAHTNTSNWVYNRQTGTTPGSWGTTWADGMVDANGKTTYKTTVNLKGGTISGDAYGGGLGDANIAALVYGDVLVKLNETTASDNCVVKGHIFGCNNVNGTPKGDVTVHVYKTQGWTDDRGTEDTTDDVSHDQTSAKSTNAERTGTVYELAAVYGGGNQAAYIPASPYTTTNTTGSKSQVIIEGCEYTSIETVYGGGNAAAVPETNVEIREAYEIGSVFGGGNGKDNIIINNVSTPNPGADVGVYKEGTTETTYGTGNANTILKGGYIHEAYGGSNQKGNIKGKININTNPEGTCDLDVEKLVGAGKNADVDGDLIMILGCKPTTKTPLVFAGADNADVNGNVELTITSGTFGQVFGGNNLGGVIKGHIVLNIEETGCNPIVIDELYLGGNQAAYSRYGYYNAGTETTPDIRPRTAAMHAIAEGETGYVAPLTNPSNTDNKHPFPYAEPVLNIVSATSIGKVFGGGLGEGAVMHANPTVNINMIKGTATGSLTTLGTIGDVFGGGNAANVIGNTTVNIGTETKVQLHQSLQADGVTYNMSDEQDVLGANITGNVYGGGQLADVGQYDVDNDHVDVAGNTYVNIGAKYNTTSEKWESVAEGTSKVLIAGNVFGGGEGEAAESGAGAFKCAKAIVTGGTNIHIGNGTINGTVYGGGEVGRVEGNSVVTIGIGAGGTTPASAPIILGDVFGAGKGKKTHGYSALMRGNPTVTIEGDAKVRGSVYGGGEIASVGKYNVKKGDNDPVGAPADVLVGMPYSLANSGSGYCTVVIRGNAEIGPEEEMKMTGTTSGKPDDTGHVFGAGKGVLPYEGYGVDGDDWKTDPWRVSINDQKDIFNSSSTHGANYEKEYFKFIETLALATETNVTIGGNAFVKGSVYGGSMNGHVQHDTHVTIAGGQIGQGEGASGRYTDWTSSSLAECPHWEFEANSGVPYDPMATTSGSYDYTKYGFVPTAARKTSSEGGLPVAKDGHTYYGNVFGGGSGVIPYAPGLWHRGAGSVGGDTYVNITGGHILTSVYGGNEHTDVGTYEKDASGQPTTTPAANDARGKCTVNMTGGTVGVPRTDAEKVLHPVVGNVFGAGKGDQRIFFNTWTNVINTEVNISGDARIFGSVFGGGEDGHVINDAETNIGNVTIKTGKDEHGDEITGTASENGLIIGTTGTSYYDGHVFGGGRGFSGEAQTAGTVGGNVRVNINAGSVYGSVYGGGRLASVGTQFTAPDDDNYGNFVEDETGTNAKTYGHVTINISGGTIGNDTESTLIASEGHWYDHTKGGNVFGGSMGRLTLLNGSTNEIWPKMAQVKETNVTISGEAVIKSNVYGGGELGTVRDNAKVTINGGTVRRDVYGGGYGSKDDDIRTIFNVKEPNSTNTGYDTNTYAFTPMQFAGCVGKSTTVNMSDGYVRKSIYGGGEMASVGIINCQIDSVTTEPSKDKVVVAQKNGKYYFYKNMVKHWDEDNEFALSWPFKFNYMPTFDGATHINITGGRIGTTQADDYGTDNGDIYGGGKGFAGDYDDFAFCANVGSANVNIDYTNDSQKTLDPATYWTTGGDCIAGAVYGGGENGHVIGDTYVTLTDGLIGHGMYGGGSGKDQYEKSLLKIGADYESTSPADHYTREIYSITAGKVFGNTNVTMNGGYVVRNVYGGGTMGSVGKGNYAGGTDDYATGGYGENAGGKLWDKSNDNSKAFMETGICTVKIHGGTVGYTGTKDGLPYGNVFGGCRGDAAPNITESPRYLYYPEFFVGYANETIVEIGAPNSTTGPTIWGSVYGGGQDGHVRRDATVTINSGKIGKAFTGAATDVNNVEWLHSGNVYGAGSGISKYNYTYHYADARGDVAEESNSTSAGSVTRFTKVEVKGGTIHRNVYGGGSLASVGAPKIDQTYDEYRKDDTASGPGNQTLNEVIISGGQIGDDSSYDTNDFHVYGGNVYGGSRGDLSLDNRFSTALYTSISITDNANVKGDVYGGGEAGTVKGDVDVEMTGGNVGHDVYGGGALADTQTSNWNATGGTDGNGDWTDATNKSALHKTTVNLLGGTISGNAYGGGLGRVEVGTSGQTGYVAPIEAYVYGDVTVKLNEGKTADDKGCIVNKVFGCNNLNGTPKGKVQVYVYATQNKDKADIKTKYAKHEGFEETGTPSTYDVAAVYGGGNLSPYNPVDANSTDADAKEAAQTEVYIYGCDLTSIKQVYGGGNAAPAPATYVRVDGAYEIEELFGGGNGKDNYSLKEGNATVWYVNPGANVGYKNYTHLDGTGDGTEAKPYNCVENDNATTKEGRQTAANGYMYGSGVAHIEVFGGNIHASYGGSNEKGNISTKAWSKYEEGGTCDLNVPETYGGGKNSLIDGEIVLDLGCTTYMPEVFGGSKNADVNSDIVLNISNGKYDRVFGGNNTSGNIYGSITVNIKEDGCVPVEIGELYLGGYLAGYSVYGYNADGSIKKSGTRLYADPRINIISATRIDNVFGGGYQADVVGNPHVNVNMEQGKVEVTKTLKEGTTDEYIYKDGGHNKYTSDEYTIEQVGEKYYAVLPIGTIGNVYGGGNEADIIGDTYVEIGTGTQHNDAGELVAISPARNAAKITGNVFGGGKGKADEFTCAKAMVGVVDSGTGSTNVTIGNGTVNGNVYGGGEIGRVEANTNVTIGLAGNETNEIIVKGNVFGAGAGLSTHGYSALVRGNSTVTVQGKAQIEKSVYGGGEIATVGRYNVVNGMPTTNVSGGDCTVRIKDNAQIADDVFGAGKGVTPAYDVNDKPKKMNASSGWDTLESEDAYLSFLETLALASNTKVTIDGNAAVKGNVYGGSESGFVQHNTAVTIAGGAIGSTTADGNVFGGGLGLATFAEAGRVRGNATVTVNGGAVRGNVYGGGQLGDVGTIVKSADYNYKWTNEANPGTTYTWNETGVCNVNVNGGTIGTGVAMNADGIYANGNVFGAGKGLEDTWWCEKAIAYKTNVTITDGTINGTVYGGGQVGRVENNTVVTIGTANETGTGSKPNIIGNVFGAGAGIKTHGYSALVRGDATVTVQGIAQVGGSVYGGGEIASVGRFTVVGGLPKHPDSGGTCTVTIQDHAKIGADGTGHNVFGACKGVTPAFVASGENRSKSMQLATNAPSDASLWSYCDENDHTFIWRYYPDETAYLDFLETLALTSHPIVTIAEDATINGSVFGGGERGITLGSVEVNMNGGTVTKDVYGGGALANSNKGNWDASTNTWAEGKVVNGKTEYTTTVNLTGGTIGGEAYGGGLGEKTGVNGATSDVEAIVYGDVLVDLNKDVDKTAKGCIVDRIFGANNVNGTPKGHVRVHVHATQNKDMADISTKVKGAFDVSYVFGGGNAADYVPDEDRQSTEVIIEGCGLTSINEVYGGGYGAATPGTNVMINGTDSINNVFGGGYGAGADNPGANVGYRTGGTIAYGKDTDKEDAKIAVVELLAGKVNNVYGGSNTKGDIRGGASVNADTKWSEGIDDPCAVLKVDKIYGGGKDAPMEGGAEIVVDCMPRDFVSEIYAGAENADVENDVSLTITSGRFGGVYGGNKSGGELHGGIKVNIEECDVCPTPVVIGELYGGGNLAPYSIYGYYEKDGKLVPRTEEEYNKMTDAEKEAEGILEGPHEGPIINIRSFTSIGNIYGGGLGEEAVLIGNPVVNINEAYVERKYAGDYAGETRNGVDIPAYSKSDDKIGVIGNVYGGGNAAKVIGNTTVNVGTEVGDYVLVNSIIPGKTGVESYFVRTGGSGTTTDPYVYTLAKDVESAYETNGNGEKKAQKDVQYFYLIVGANVKGNIYGGGNNAEVTGSSNVVIGKKKVE